MAIDVVSLGSVGNTANQQNYGVDVARAPAANTLVLVSVLMCDNAGAAHEPSSVSGAGLVFSLITSSQSFNTPSNAGHNLSMWRSMGASPDDSRITVHFDGSPVGCALLVAEVSGVSTSGVSGANAIGSSIGTVSGVSNGQLVEAPSAASTANAWYTAWGRSVSNVGGQIAHVNFTSVDSATFSNLATALSSAWTSLSSGNTMQWKATDTAGNGALMVELVADNPAAGGAVISPYYASYYYPKVVAA